MSLWERLGAPKYVMAPMVGQSELAFRMFCKRYNTQLSFTPMVWSDTYCKDEGYRTASFQTCDQDNPLVTQICGNDPDMCTFTAKSLQQHSDVIDLNLGCPQDLARERHIGAFLCDDWDLVNRVVRQMCGSLDVPVSCKIRKIKDTKTTIEFAQMLEHAGIQLLSVHGRTKEQQRYGRADWDLIRDVKQAMRVPVIANGNIHHFSDIEDCLQYTGADSVMSAEALLANPALFSGACPDPISLAREYIEISKQYPTPVKCVAQHVSNMLMDKIAPHRRSYLKMTPKHTIHSDMWTRFLQADSVSGVSDLLDELEGRIARNERPPRRQKPKSVLEEETTVDIDGESEVIGGLFA